MLSEYLVVISNTSYGFKDKKLLKDEIVTSSIIICVTIRCAIFLRKVFFNIGKNLFEEFIDVISCRLHFAYKYFLKGQRYCLLKGGAELFQGRQHILLGAPGHEGDK